MTAALATGFLQVAERPHCAWTALQEPEALIAAAQRKLSTLCFDTMVGTGLSGALVIPTLARAMGKRWMILRKAHDCDTTYSHGRAPVLGLLGRRWLFVDDLRVTDITLLRVTRAIDALCAQRDWKTEFVGTFEYHGARLSTVALRQRLAAVLQRPAECVDA